MAKKKTIKERHEDIQNRLKKHDAARKVIEGELKALRHECDHPKTEQWHDSGWGRMPSDEFHCPDSDTSSARWSSMIRVWSEKHAR